MIFNIRNFAILASLTAGSVHAETWRSDLDWASLEAKLSPNASLVDTSFSDFQEQCLPEFRDKTAFDRTNHELTDEPSGMCVSQMFCAYERCWPRPEVATRTQAQRALDEQGAFDDYDSLSAETQGWLSNPQNPSLNLPSKVVFPSVASDVVHVIRFAKENGLEISVKNSGHSLIGASTKKDTLHINMNRFVQYSATNVVGCESSASIVRSSSLLGDQPCDLVNARNKPGFVRAGGGENWDKVYRAVEAVNTAEGNTYHAVGGAAGTVSPMGWTFQGGLGGTTGGRMYGFGVDQVLQVEMVLPNGEHVRFGPVEWDDADGFIVPKTTSVAGVCRSNPEELNENLWEWAECPADLNINFDDLWFAVNGGGGGTWGVVTSIFLQLQDYQTPRMFGLDNDIFSLDNCDPAIKAIVGPIFERFRLRYVMVPSTFSVITNSTMTQADSDGCGFADAGLSALFCYGDRPYQTLVNEWEKFAALVFSDPATFGISLEQALSCPATLEVSWAEYAKGLPVGGPSTGQIKDYPIPSLGSISAATLNILVPQKYIDENFETALEEQFWWAGGPGFYLAFGSGTGSASDQANSLGAAHRTAGFKRTDFPADIFYSDYFGQYYDLSDKSNFPSFQGSNHIGPQHMGPLKDDWTKVCPDEWTMQERDEKCVSIQETIYGTKTLARLEAIKEAVDPDYMFDCFGCIGNNRKKETDEETTSGEADTNDKEETTSEEADTKEEETASGEADTEWIDPWSAGRVASFEASLLAVLSVGTILIW